jgi:hypothetical protein
MKFGEGISVEQFKKEVKRHQHASGRNKFNAMKVSYGGVMYDSKAEAGYAMKLDLLKKAPGADKVVSYERQVKFSFDHNGKHICSYQCDFVVTFGDSRVEYHEVKGYETRESSIKRKLMEAFYGVKIKVIKQQ